MINRGTVYGSITNHETGLLLNEQGAWISVIMDNHGSFQNIGSFVSPQTGAFQNRATARSDSPRVG